MVLILALHLAALLFKAAIDSKNVQAYQDHLPSTVPAYMF